MSEEIKDTMPANEEDVELTGNSLGEVNGGYEENNGYQIYDVPLKKADRIREDLAKLATQSTCTKAQAKSIVKKSLSENEKKKYPDLIKLIDDLADEIYGYYGKA